MPVDDPSVDRERNAGRELTDKADVLVGRNQPGPVLGRVCGAQTEFKPEPIQGLEGA
jgi:hypothetical protein